MYFVRFIDIVKCTTLSLLKLLYLMLYHFQQNNTRQVNLHFVPFYTNNNNTSLDKLKSVYLIFVGTTKKVLVYKKGMEQDSCQINNVHVYGIIISQLC